MAGDASSIPGLLDPLEKEMANSPVFLPGKSIDSAWWATVSGHKKSWMHMATKQQHRVTMDVSCTFYKIYVISSRD